MQFDHHFAYSSGITAAPKRGHSRQQEAAIKVVLPTRSLGVPACSNAFSYTASTHITNDRRLMMILQELFFLGYFEGILSAVNLA